MEDTAMTAKRGAKHVKLPLWVVGLGIVVAIVIVVAFIGANGGGKSSADIDVFEGYITTENVTPGKFSGVGIFDKDCISLGKTGLTQCQAGIETKEYGLLNFGPYIHYMEKVGCIGPGDQLS